MSPYISKYQWFVTFESIPFRFSLQHRGRVRAGGRRRDELQGLLHPSQIREGAGSGGDHNPPQPGDQARDLGRTHCQQLNADARRGREGGGQRPAATNQGLV